MSEAGSSSGPGRGNAPPEDDATRISPLPPPERPPEPSPAPSAGQATPSAAPAAPNATPPGRPAAPLPRPAPVSAPLAGGAAPQSPAPGTLPGSAASGSAGVRQVGRYQIVSRVGSGAMATVFKAHDPDIGRDVAIKFLHPALCEEAGYRARFLREARAAGGLSHPNIVTVHDVGEIEGRPYMAMELIEGQPLSDLMDQGKPLPLRDVLVMGIQLARALDYAHARGVVHRDIKPGNILRLKGSRTIKVTDFGIAHMDSGADQRTRVGDILGTPQYMSPEQTQGSKIDGRSDLFSAGIVLYQMLTGQRPFLGEGLVALAMQIANEDPVPIEKLRPGLPHALRRVVERCLAKAPERRFQTGKELAEALARVLTDLDASARDKDRPRIVPLRVKWAAMMALIVAVVMALTATVITQRQYAAMMSQVTDYGAALTRFIAAQNAVSALSEDWVAVEVAVQEVMKTRAIDSVTVIDREGIVRAAARPEAVGKAYQAPAAQRLDEREGGITVSRYLVNDETLLSFEAPITFRGKQVGRVALGLPERPLAQVARLSMILMVVLVVVTVLAVAVAMYFVANWFAQPIKLVTEAMGEIARGRFDHRIREQRKDEFGHLFAAFDQMAQALQDRHPGTLQISGGAPLAPAAPPPPGSPPLPPAPAAPKQQPAP
ncbi:protein kinase [Aquabacterium sp. A7-Y]|uniref:protein kinase domain-containing protein n=1 Tax=Aquabacterium sp. A7-Y TaxID=1349605 RepID=UPI00223CCC68|nr:protein kinase [Aquabacterium sp. A7-Y]MCW7539776.1 protein kinase [Aquabacterium sp. A7-Y]